MPRIDPKTAPARGGTRYPAPHDAPCKARSWSALGEAAGLTQFGVNLIRIPPGSWSSHRHWHMLEDEFVWVVEGQATMVTDGGRETLGPGDSAGFPAGVRDGHHFINEGPGDLVLLVVGSRNDADYGEYSDIDMKFGPERYSGAGHYTRKDGTPI